MYQKADKKYIYWIIELFLSKKIDTNSFCNCFHDSYGLEIETENLTNEEESCLDSLNQVARRCTTSEEDLKSSGFFYSEKELREKVKEVHEKLGSLDALIKKELKVPNLNISKIATSLDEKWLMCPDCIDAWECSSQDAMVICPMCNQVLHNPRYENKP